MDTSGFSFMRRSGVVSSSGFEESPGGNLYSRNLTKKTLFSVAKIILLS